MNIYIYVGRRIEGKGKGTQREAEGRGRARDTGHWCSASRINPLGRVLGDKVNLLARPSIRIASHDPNMHRYYNAERCCWCYSNCNAVRHADCRFGIREHCPVLLLSFSPCFSSSHSLDPLTGSLFPHFHAANVLEPSIVSVRAVIISCDDNESLLLFARCIIPSIPIGHFTSTLWHNVFRLNYFPLNLLNCQRCSWPIQVSQTAPKMLPVLRNKRNFSHYFHQEFLRAFSVKLFNSLEPKNFNQYLPKIMGPDQYKTILFINLPRWYSSGNRGTRSIVEHRYFVFNSESSSKKPEQRKP